MEATFLSPLVSHTVNTTDESNNDSLELPNEGERGEEECKCVGDEQTELVELSASSDKLFCSHKWSKFNPS